MSLETITFHVIKAENINPFITDGQRNMHFHFFMKTETGWDFRWIDETMSKEWLLQKIDEGVVYIFND